jgi:ADP-ribose pyrophosphatase YjhB (NUDIX family)
MSDWAEVRARLAERTDRVLADLRETWEPATGTTDAGDAVPTADTVQVGPRGHDPDAPPGSLAGHLDVCAGLASVVVGYTDACAETVVVYNPGGFWEPPGGVVEADQSPAEAARTEAREEIGVEVDLTGLLSLGECEFRYANGATAPVPVATFLGHRVGGSLRVERERIDHPGVTRAVGVFDRATLPDCRDRETIVDALDRAGPA